MYGIFQNDLLEIISVNRTIVIELRYATQNNFTRECIYSSNAKAYLLRFVAERLDKVQKYLNKKKLGLKIWDAYRPPSTQWRFWQLVPDERYVTNPAKEGGRHSRGTTIDATLIDLKTGKELLMPTKFDDFTQKAHSDYMDLPQEVIENREILYIAMKKFGFKINPFEWWHFDIEEWKNYPVLDIEF